MLCALMKGPARPSRWACFFRKNQNRAAPIIARPATPPITPPIMAPVLLFLEIGAADAVGVLEPVFVGTLLAVGRVEEALVLELFELVLEEDEDVLVVEVELELEVVEVVVLLLLVLVEEEVVVGVVVDVVVGAVVGAVVGVKRIPVNTCWRSTSVGWPLYVVSTVVAQLDSPHPYW